MSDSPPSSLRLGVVSPDGAIAREAAFEGRCEIGRAGGDLTFPEDEAMADCEASVRREGDEVIVTDLGAGSGVWRRLTGPDGEVVGEGDQLWLGAQILVVESSESGWRLVHHGADGSWRGRYAVPPAGLMIGRGSELVLDAGDGRLSRRHAQVVPEATGLRVYDRGARNGTFRKLTGPTVLGVGDEIRVAQQRLRVLPEAPPAEPVEAEAAPIEDPQPPVGLGARLRALGRRRVQEEVTTPSFGDAPRSHEEETEEATALSPVPETEEATALSPVPETGEATALSPVPETNESARHSASSGETGVETFSVEFEDSEGPLIVEARAGQTLLDAVRAAGHGPGRPIDWECGDGGCGVCIVGVVEGAGSLDPPDPESGEMKTIQITEQVAPDPDRYRLACLARVRGAVRLRSLA